MVKVPADPAVTLVGPVIDEVGACGLWQEAGHQDVVIRAVVATAYDDDVTIGGRAGVGVDGYAIA